MRLKLPAIAPGREAQVAGQVPANLLVVPLVDFTAAGKNGKSSMPVLDFVTLQVTGLVGNNTIVAAVILPLATCSTGTTSSQVEGTGLKVVLCSDSGCPSASGGRVCEGDAQLCGEQATSMPFEVHHAT